MSSLTQSLPLAPPLRLTEPVAVPAAIAQGREDFLVFGKPTLGESAMAEVRAVLESGWLGTGPRVAAFERAFAQYKQVPATRAVALNSCTAGLHLALVVAGVGPGDEVITTPMTFCATVNAILHAGATPVLADVDPVTQNLDPAAVAAAITPRTVAILPVHFAGRPCAMDALETLAERHGLVLIEDCAHAIETQHHGRPAGTIGRFGCFSFYATKNLTTGEGGMLLCRDEKDAERARRLSLHGLSHGAHDRFGPGGFSHYTVVEPGFKYNMMDLQAALGLHQLQQVEPFARRRAEIVTQYDNALADLPITTPASAAPRTRHAHHLYPLLINETATGCGRDRFLSEMKSRNIGVGVHYLALPEHPFYQQALGWRPEDCPVATRIGRQTASIPLTPYLTGRDVAGVIAAVKEALSSGTAGNCAKAG